MCVCITSNCFLPVLFACVVFHSLFFFTFPCPQKLVLLAGCGRRGRKREGWITMQKYRSRRNQLQVTWTAEHSTALCSIKTTIVNTATDCCSHGQALGLNAIIPTHYCVMFWLSNVNVLKVKMTVAEVVNFGEMFEDCGWEWVLVNRSQIGLVSQRYEKPEENLKRHLCARFNFFSFFNCCTTPNSVTCSSVGWRRSLNGGRIPSWGGSESLWWNEAWNASALGFVMLPLEILI